jgi:hypothetical protein
MARSAPVSAPPAPIFEGTPPGDGTFTGWSAGRNPSNYKNNPVVTGLPAGSNATASSVRISYNLSQTSSPVQPVEIRLYYSLYENDSNPTLVEDDALISNNNAIWNVYDLEIGTIYYFKVAVTNSYATSLTAAYPYSTLDNPITGN